MVDRKTDDKIHYVTGTERDSIHGSDCSVEAIEHGIPEGGYGWVVVLASFLSHLVIGGFMRAGGVIFLRLEERFHGSAASTAWVVSLAVTVRMLFGPLASALCNRFSCRTVVMMGGVLLTTGVLISGFAGSLSFLYFSYSAVGGIGRAFIYTPAVVIVALYFDRRRGTAAGISNSGIGFGTFVVPPAVEVIFTHFGFSGAFFILAAFSFHVCVFGAMLRPLSVHSRIVGTKRAVTRCVYLGNNHHDSNLGPLKQEFQSQSSIIRDYEIRVRSDSDAHSVRSARNAQTAHAHKLTNKRLLIEDVGFKSNSSSNIATDYEIRVRPSSFRSSAFSLQHLPGADVGALCISSSNRDVTGSLVGSLGSLFKLNHSKHDIDRDRDKKTGPLLLDRETESPPTTQDASTKWLDVSLLKDIRFLTFCIGIGLYTLSFQATYVFIPPLSIQNGLSKIEAAYLVSIAGALETLGSIVSGIILDFKQVKPHRLHIYNFVMFLLGALTLILPFVRSFPLFAVISGLYGFLLGSCLAQKSTLVVDILGVSKLVSSFGILVCFQGFGVLIGPPLSGFLKDLSGVYDEGFYFGAAAMVASGIVQTIGAVIHHLRSNKNKK